MAPVCGPWHNREPMTGAKIGDHICCVFHTDQEHFDIAASYIAEGLRGRQQCLYSAASPAALDRFKGHLASHGLDVEGAIGTGALLAKTARESHLRDGEFQSEAMLQMMGDQLESALNAGFVGLRTCGDMSWLLERPDATEDVVIYEALCSEFFRNSRAVGMCMYDRGRLPQGLLDHALSTHPCIVAGGACRPNPSDRSAEIIEEFARRSA